MSKDQPQSNSQSVVNLTTRQIIENFLNAYGFTNELLKQHGYEKEEFHKWQYSNKAEWKRLEETVHKKVRESVFSLLKEQGYIKELKQEKVINRKDLNTESKKDPDPGFTTFRFTQLPKEKESKKPTIESINEEFCQSFNENLLKVAEQLKGTNTKQFGPIYKKKNFTQKRVLNLLLSDLHFQSLLDPREVPFVYGSVEEARRLAAVVKATCEYKTQYRDDTVLNIHLLGDIIDGRLHDQSVGAPLAEQVAAALHLLTQAVQVLSMHYLHINIYTAVGNHGRNVARHPNRAITQKWDAIETILYSSLKKSCQDLPNVQIEVGYKPWYDCKIFSNYGFFTHGDTVIQPGSPSKSINIANMRKQTNEINATAKDGKSYSLFAVGHVHVPSQTYLPNGVVFVTNGALISPDSYALSLGIMDAVCSQWLLESIPERILGDSRLITVGEKDDKNSELDQIIRPFVSLC